MDFNFDQKIRGHPLVPYSINQSEWSALIHYDIDSFK